MPSSDFILKTKFFLPQISSDFVERKRLQEKFDQLKDIPVMLISASSGYGKSMVTSHFLKNQDEKYVWLSLSEKENDTFQFIRYFVLAIQAQVPGFGDEVLELISVPNPPSGEEFAELLENELAGLSHLLYMTLDDYHLIKNQEVHHLISKLFEYSQPFFRLIILTRRDPELPLLIWRSKNQIIDVRSSHLKFYENEISELYLKALNVNANAAMLSSLQTISKGWVSGIRMLMLAKDPVNQKDPFMNNFNFKNSEVILDLVNSVLSRQSDEIKERLLKLSLLSEFNLELFATLCLTDQEQPYKKEKYKEFISELINSNLFITSLDDKRNWYRFHHLFQEQLQLLLNKEMETDVVDSLREKASKWFLNNDFIEEAISQLNQVGQFDRSLEIFTDYRLTLMSQTRFQRLESILFNFPEFFRKKKSVLLITEGWILLQKGNIPKMAEHLEHLEIFLKKEDLSEELFSLLMGELHTMKTFDTYLSNVDLNACLEHCEKAIELLNGRHPYALGMAWVYYGATLQHKGQTIRAKKEIFKMLEFAEEPMLRGHLLLIVIFIDWFEGSLDAVIDTAEHLLDLGMQTGIKMLIVNGNIFKGISLYYQNKDQQARAYLIKSDELRRYTYLHMSFGTGMALADIYAKEEEFEKKDEIIKKYEATAIHQGGKLFNTITKSASASLKWKYQNERSGLKWAKENDYTDFLPLASLFSPEIVQAEILVLDDDQESLDLAQKILDLNIEFFQSRNDKNVLIRAYVIQALLFYKNNKRKEALKTLEQAFELTTSGHFIRPYKELGEEMRKLILLYKDMRPHDVHADEILTSFEDHSVELVTLSMRESEVLQLLPGRTNKEVANKLFISEKTVKTHITNIYKKLQVINKQEAIVKAKSLSLIE